MNKSYSIGVLSRLSAVSVPTIRHYEKQGLLPASQRGSNGYRYYSDADLQRLQLIKAGRTLDFSLAQIAILLNFADAPDAPCAQANALALQHLHEIEQKIARLNHVATILREAVRCHAQQAVDCRVIGVLQCTQTEADIA